MRSLKPRNWTPHKEVEVQVTEEPHVLYVRNASGIVAFPAGIYKNFKSLDEITDLVGRYLEAQNG